MRTRLRLLAIVGSFVILATVLAARPASAGFFFGPKVLSNDEIFRFISDLVGFGFRRPGTEPEAAAARYIENKFREFGLEEVRIEEVPMTRWDATRWSLTLDNGQTVDSFYVPYTKLTGPQGKSGRLLYLGEGSEADFANAGNLEGAVVVVEMRFLDVSFTGLVHHPYSWVLRNWDAYDRAIAGKAAAFVGILRDYWDRNTFYSPADNPLKRFDTRTIPGLWLAKSDGDRLLAQMRAGEARSARVVLEGREVQATMKNVVGMLPGMTDDVLMIHSHHDAPFYGAVEDASGVAEVLAIAKYFSEIPRSWRKKTLLFLSASGHFHNYMGNQAFIADHPELMSRTLLDFCVEHVALEYTERDGQIVATGYHELAGLFVSSPVMQPIASAAATYWGLKNTIVAPYPFRTGFFSDARDYQAFGIPVVSYISGPSYIYDLNDTLEKVAKDQLRPVAASFVDMIIAADELHPSAFFQY